MNRFLGTTYGALFAGLLALLSLGILGIAGFAGSALIRDLNRELHGTCSEADILHHKKILLENEKYLRSRLSSLVEKRDISAINLEIDNLKRWLPAVSVLIIDQTGRVLTDGSAANPRYGEKIDLSPPASSDAPLFLHTPSGETLFLALDSSGETAEYARIRIDHNPSAALPGSLAKTLDDFREGVRRSLLMAAAATFGLITVLGFYLNHRFRRSLSGPLTEIGRAADQYATGNLEPQLKIRSRNEIGDLARSLNKMAGNLKKTGQLLSKAQEMAGLGSWEWHRATNQLILSPGALKIMGFTRKNFELRLEYLLELLKPDDRLRVTRALHLSQKKNIAVEFSFFRNYEERLIQLQAEPVREVGESLGGCIGTIRDVTEQRLSEKRMIHLANYDILTDLPNRNLFQERLAHAISQANRKGSSVAVMFIDLDRFKDINDSLGHHMGDKLLTGVATRLLKILREYDTLARLGGDEFTVILEDLDSPQGAAVTARKILEKLSRSFILEGHELFVTASIGITIYPRDAGDIGTLLKNADTAMYLAKDEGKSTYRFFTPELNILAHNRMDLENNLRKANKKREFEIHYQPQLDLRTGELTAMEALLRWHHKDKWIPPDEFIPVLDETGMLSELTGWMLKEACTRTSHWRQAGFRDLRIAVNLTAKQVQQDNLIHILQKTLKLTGLPPGNLELEITENALVNQKEADSNLSHIKKLGVKLAVDDFGTGYSSLSYLKMFNVDTLKIDRAFIRDILIDKNDALITRAVVALSKHLGITTVAEGVETGEQLDLLQELGCDIVQGYFISRPLPPEDFHAWARQQQNSILSFDESAYQSA